MLVTAASGQSREVFDEGVVEVILEQLTVPFLGSQDSKSPRLLAHLTGYERMEVSGPSRHNLNLILV